MGEVRRTLLVRSSCTNQLAEVLTGYGKIVGMDHEGTITYEIEGPDEFELGRLSYEIQNELRSYYADVDVVSAVKDKQMKQRLAPKPRKKAAKR